MDLYEVAVELEKTNRLSFTSWTLSRDGTTLHVADRSSGSETWDIPLPKHLYSEEPEAVAQYITERADAHLEQYIKRMEEYHRGMVQCYSRMAKRFDS